MKPGLAWWGWHIPFSQKTLPSSLDLAFVDILYEYLLLHVQVQRKERPILLKIMFPQRLRFEREGHSLWALRTIAFVVVF
jgi:hypothetical protein